MTELLTAAQMRAIEQAAIASGEVTGLELMERAGQGVVDAILEWRPELATAPHRAVVLCGPGNNGGDGFVVARLLKQRGWEVEVYLYGDEAKLPPDAGENARRWREVGAIRPFPPEVDAICANADKTVIVDAIFGTGLGRPIEGTLREVVEKLRERPLGARGMIISVDLPSGVCADSGRVLGSAIGAELAVSFHSEKRGHRLAEAPELATSLVVKSIGLAQRHADPFQSVTLTDQEICLTIGKDFFNRDAKRHKYSHGHAFILSGGPGKGGAARLAARGALRIGAGLVTVGCPDEALTENAARLDAIMLAPIKGVDSLQAELRDRKVKAVCIGPGFGLGERLRSFVSVILQDGPGAHPTADGNRIGVVLDADALTEFRDDPETLFAMLHRGCVLTPHEGEFGRLFPDILAKLKEPATKGPGYSKVDATREAAKRAGCVVLFKGADTVIAHPDGRCSINSAHYERSAPWLATAGSGDVLAGFITGLLARGFDPMSAAETASWLHVECARSFGPGLIAEDIPEQLPAVFRELGL